MENSLEEAASLGPFDAKNGWPESLNPEQAIALQCRRIGTRWSEYRNHPDTRELTERVRLAIKAGALAHTTTEVEKLLVKGGRITIGGIDGGRRFLGGTLGNATVAYMRQPEYKTDTQHHITAEAFAAWLAANDIEPSRHVSAWFKSQAVDTDRRTIAPPEGWKAQSPHGMQRINATDAGRLVRLADVVQWLMDTRELPCKNAVEEVCSTLEQRPSAAAGWLYLLTENGYAKLLMPEHSFFYTPILDFSEPYPTGEACDKGLAGAIKYMREYWGQSPAPGAGNWMGQHVLDPLAIRIDAAHLLWGYGRRLEAIEPPQAAAPAATAAPMKETPAKRNSRWLAIWDEERRTGTKVGHQARAVRRIVQADGVTQATAKKGLQVAEKARAEKYRDGKVSPIKRKSGKQASPFDGLRKKT